MRKISSGEFEQLLKQSNEEELVGILDRGNLSGREFDLLVEEMENRGMHGTIMEVPGSPQDEQGLQIMEYLDYHDKMPREGSEDEKKKNIKKAIGTIENKEAHIEELKLAIMILAHAGDIKGLRALENYYQTVPSELEGWVATAIGECQMFIESELSNEPTVRLKKLPRKR